jgi:serine protease
MNCDRIDQIVQKMPGDELDNLEDFRHAYQIFLTRSEPALHKLDAAPVAPLSGNEVLALEAVIKADVSRPALLIRDDTIDPEHPLATAWRGALYSVRNRVRKRAAAVGRIGPQNQSVLDYSGTGWLLDDQQGIVLTNWHILRDLLTKHPAAFTSTATGFKIQENAVTIDFFGESGSVVKKRFQLVEATQSPCDKERHFGGDILV